MGIGYWARDWRAEMSVKDCYGHALGECPHWQKMSESSWGGCQAGELFDEDEDWGEMKDHCRIYRAHIAKAMASAYAEAEGLDVEECQFAAEQMAYGAPACQMRK